MVQLVVGKKGKGKTKIVLEMVNKEITIASGNIVYLDKGNDHMYELNMECPTQMSLWALFAE
jgi:ABC-type proline/glycine betaine transport system ATPase subunit